MDWKGYLHGIENCEDSMTRGRRNNDVVNWTLAKLAVWCEDFENVDGLSSEQLIEEFKEKFDTTSLNIRHYDWEDKIETVFSYYRDLDPDEWEALLVDVEY